MLRKRNLLICVVAASFCLVAIESVEACDDCYFDDYNMWMLFWCDYLEYSWLLDGHQGAASMVYPQPIPWHGSLIQLSWDGGDTSSLSDYGITPVVSCNSLLVNDGAGGGYLGGLDGEKGEA